MNFNDLILVAVILERFITSTKNRICQELKRRELAIKAIFTRLEPTQIQQFVRTSKM
jgi:hypothetical protein